MSDTLRLEDGIEVLVTNLDGACKSCGGAVGPVLLYPCPHCGEGLEPWIEVEGRKIQGDELTAYHKEHKTASYHCMGCGGPMDEPKYPCEHCGYGAEGESPST